MMIYHRLTNVCPIGGVNFVRVYNFDSFDPFFMKSCVNRK